MTKAPTQRKSSPANQLLIDLGPIAVFVIAFNVFSRFEATKADAPFLATGLFIVAVLAAIAFTRIRTGRVPPVLIVTGVFVTAFGGLSILLRNEQLIQDKVTVVNGFYAAAILVSLALRQNVWKLLFGHMWTLPDRIWNILALRWAGYFIVMAIFNEVLRRGVDFTTWTNLRLLVAFVPFFLFFFANAPLVLKHHVETDGKPGDATVS